MDFCVSLFLCLAEDSLVREPEMGSIVREKMRQKCCAELRNEREREVGIIQRAEESEEWRVKCN